MRFFVLAVVVLLPLRGARAAPPDRIDRRGTSEVVEAAANAIRDNYVFAEDAERVGRELRARLRTGAYRHVRRKQELAQRLTGDLVEITGDQHFSVGVDAAWVRAFREASESDAVASPQDPAHQRAAAANFGFQSVRLLPGNVGYVRLDHFDDPDVGAPVAAAAMRFVEHTDALIFDLRYNRGGTMAMAQLLMSYLFEADEAQLLFDFTTTESGEALERGMWVLPSVPGRRRPERPVYVLTGSTSFSAAEWFSFALQKLGRAEIIGERTTGAAHPVASVPIDDTFFVRVPVGQIRDPVDGTDFEGVGVEPDVRVDAHSALGVAHLRAFEAIVRTKGEDDALRWSRPVVEANAQPPPSPSTVARAIGRYEGRELLRADDRIVYRWRDRFRLVLQPLTPTLFAVEGIGSYRFRLIEKGGRIVALEKVNDDGSTTRYARID